MGRPLVIPGRVDIPGRSVRGTATATSETMRGMTTGSSMKTTSDRGRPSTATSGRLRQASVTKK